MRKFPKKNCENWPKMYEILKLDQVEISASTRKFILQNFPKNAQPENAEFLAIAPGRVNLIGEHVDYCGFPVLPMALENSTFLKFSSSKIGENSGGLSINFQNVETAVYPNFSVDLDLTRLDDPKYLQNLFQKSGSNKTFWYQYLLAGMVGIYQFLKSQNLALETNFQLDILLHSNVPPAAGLSSSSSCVVAACLMALKIFPKNFKNFSDLPLTKQKLASLAAESEKYIGTAGGGMDQAISLLAEKNKVSSINFLPEISTQNFDLPENISIVVAHSNKTMEKANTNDFNERVLCCKYGTKILSDGKFEVLKEFLDDTGLSLEAGLQLVEAKLGNDSTFGDLKSKFGDLENMARFESISDSQICQVKNRLVHVLTESMRVQKFIKTQEISKLGQLMTASQTSLRENYHCSSPELDWLCQTMLDLGCLGSRLTGAGWGGCAIGMVESAKAESFILQLKNKFREKFLTDENLIFCTVPSGGANLFEF